MFLVTCSWPSWRLVTVATAIRLCRSPTPVGHHEPCANRVLVCLFFLYRVFLGATRRPLVRRGDGPERRGCIFFGCHGRIFFFLLFFFLFEDRGRSGRLVGRQETRGQTRITEPGSVFDEACAFLESGSRRRPTRAAAGVFGSTFSLTFQPHCLVNDVVGRETRLDAAATPAGPPPSTPAPPARAAAPTPSCDGMRLGSMAGGHSDRIPLAAGRTSFDSTRPTHRRAATKKKKKRNNRTLLAQQRRPSTRFGDATSSEIRTKEEGTRSAASVVSREADDAAETGAGDRRPPSRRRPATERRRPRPAQVALTRITVRGELEAKKRKKRNASTQL